MFTEAAVRRDFEARTYVFVRLNFCALNPGTVENNFLGVFEPRTIEAHFDFGAALRAGGRGGVEARGGGVERTTNNRKQADD
jgi:hypothetical protein